jgi:hypothetical protein
MKIKIKKFQLKKIIKEEVRKMLVEQGSFETSGPSTDWALTTAQVGAMQETGKMEDAMARGIDLKGVLMNATQGSHPDFLDLLELPAFQKDPRVKEHGY